METLEQLERELKTIKDDILKAVSTDSAKVADLEKKQKEIQLQLDAVDRATQGGNRFVGGEMETKGIGDLFIESEAFKAAQVGRFGGRQPFSTTIELPSFGRKSTITTTSGITQGTTGITMPYRLPGIQIVAQQALRIRDLMNVRQLSSGNAYDFVQQLTRSNNASPQVETSPKAESTYTWNSVSDTVKTVAHYVNVSRQALDDVPWLQGMLNSELTYGLLLRQETEILSGDGLGQHVNGIIKQATAYDSSKNIAGDTKLDKIRHAILQARLAGLATFAPDGIVLNPVDLAALELIKDEAGGTNKGRYVIGDVRGGTQATTVWGLPVVESDSIVAGTFLVGAFGTAAEIVNRMEVMIEVSFENGNNFTQNVATVLAECRFGLAVYRPGAFITGAL